MYDALCLENLQTPQVAKNRCSAPGPAPATTHPVGAWSAMPGWVPGTGCSLHKP